MPITPPPTNSLIFLLLFLIGGSSSVLATDDDEYNPDPWEGMNRTINSFNTGLDDYLIRPTAEVYKAITPDPVERGVTNFFSNIDDTAVFINDLLQLKVLQGLSDLARFGINSTIGIFGLFDIAKLIGLKKHHEDLGQTLGYWGVPSGPYLVLPIFGPSTLRDGSAMIAYNWESEKRIYEGNMPLRVSLYSLELINTRANLLHASNIVEKSSTDPYLFVREAYLQQRRSLVYDGNPPDSESLDESMDEFLDL